jgi:adenylate kinase family enzyme
MLTFSNLPPNAQNIVLGIVANALTSVLAYGGTKLHSLLISTEESVPKSIGEILSQASNDLAEIIDWKGPGKWEEVCLFLCSPESEELLRQLFGIFFANSTDLLEQKHRVDSVHDRFVSALAMYIQVSPSEVEKDGGELFSLLKSACETTLEKYVGIGVLTAHEALSNYRFRLLMDALAQVDRNVKGAVTTTVDIRVIREFEDKFRRQVADHHRYLVPPDLNNQRRVPIDALFVEPRFLSLSRLDLFSESYLTYFEVIAGAYRVVVIGTPGGGKSTLAQKLALEQSIDKTSGLFGGRSAIAVVVVLREYAAEKKKNKLSILEFVEQISKSRYQIKAPDGAFDYIFEHGRGIIVFDGLDELLDTKDRQEIRNDIEAFCNLYLTIPVLVTSREVGYDQAPLDRERFETFRLGSFDENQVREYATRWFRLEIPHQNTEEVVEKFMTESQSVEDLRAVPLMLGLMCSIYRGESYIPRNRPEVYEKCAVMLFERWDRSRGIQPNLPIETDVRFAMMHLAYWIYADAGLQQGVTEKMLIDEATRYFRKRRFEDVAAAESAARQFIEFCRGRAWVFTDTGTTASGEGLYQFTHRTFLEYFTAGHLVRLNPTPEKLLNVLLPRIKKGEWDVVAQLAIRILNRNVEDAGDKLLHKLVAKAGSGFLHDWRLLSFASRCLEFLVPRPATCRQIVSKAIVASVNWGVDQLRGQASERSIESIIGPLFVAASENRATIIAELVEKLIAIINTGEDDHSVVAFELATNLNILQIFGLGATHIAQAVSSACEPRTKKLASRYLRPCLDFVWGGELSIMQLVEWHGMSSVFKDLSYVIYPNTASLSLARSILSSADSERMAWAKQIGELFLEVKQPCVDRSFVVKHFLRTVLAHRVQSVDEDAAEEAFWFGVFCIIAVAFECNSERQVVAAIPSLIRPFFTQRAGLQETISFLTIAFSGKRRELSEKWARKELDFSFIK